MSKTIKKYIVTLILICTSLYSFGQKSRPQDILTVGLNGGFYGIDYGIGPCLSIDYAYSILDYLKVSPRIMIAFTDTKKDYYSYHLSSFNFSTSLVIIPEYETSSKLQIEIGPLYQRIIYSEGHLTYKQSTSYITYPGRYYTESIFGLIWSVKLSIIQNTKIDIGNRMDILSCFNQGFKFNSIQLGVFFSHHFN